MFMKEEVAFSEVISISIICTVELKTTGKGCTVLIGNFQERVLKPEHHGYLKPTLQPLNPTTNRLALSPEIASGFNRQGTNWLTPTQDLHLFLHILTVKFAGRLNNI